MERDSIISVAPSLVSVMDAARLVAVTDVTVLLQGESGTGKELLARAIHNSSLRCSKPFICLNCAALPEGLAESELFGHRKGAFTGASQDYIGRIRSAEGGTLLLDEVGELPLHLQPKLLRFLESGECQGIGEPSPYKVSVRVIAATNRDLRKMVEQGLFRADLYYRLSVVPLELPPLRERDGDVELLLRSYFRDFAKQYNVKQPKLSKDALRLIRRYHWPGNVRELRNFCERIVILFAGREIDAGNLPEEMRVPAVFSKDHAGTITINGLRNAEHNLILNALKNAKGNKSEAARMLGISRDSLNYRLKKYGVVSA